MRTIEKNILSTLSGARSGLHSLSMRDSVEINDGVRRVYLWSHNIYELNSDGAIFSLCGWNSTTTKSRLNALLWAHFGAGIFQKDYQLYYKHIDKIIPISSDKRYFIAFSDSDCNIKEV